jgi:hypothetical protein
MLETMRVEEDRVLFFDYYTDDFDLDEDNQSIAGEAVSGNVRYSDQPEKALAFLELFDVDETTYIADTEGFYQGMTFCTVIIRKSDGRKFGYEYWQPVAKHDADAYYEPNGDEHGFESYTDKYATWVWLPVEEHVIPGYRVVK